jgi:hypothetical protein
LNSKITSDSGLLAYRELDDALGLTDTAITKLLDGRHGKNARHKLSRLFRQAVSRPLVREADSWAEGK